MANVSNDHNNFVVFYLRINIDLFLFKGNLILEQYLHLEQK